MRRSHSLLALLTLAGLAFAAQDPRKEQLKVQLKDEYVGTWIYDDINAGFAEAKKSNKPMLVVFR